MSGETKAGIGDTFQVGDRTYRVRGITPKGYRFLQLCEAGHSSEEAMQIAEAEFTPDGKQYRQPV